MNGFRVWVDGPQGTTVLVLAMLAVGTIIGWLVGVAVGRHREAEDQERLAEIDRGDAEVMGPVIDRLMRSGRRAWMELHHEDVAHYRQQLGQLHAEYEAEHGHPAFGAQAHIAWLAHSEQALDLANGVTLAPEDEAVLAGINARLDEWLAEHVYGAQQ